MFFLNILYFMCVFCSYLNFIEEYSETVQGNIYFNNKLSSKFTKFYASFICSPKEAHMIMMLFLFNSFIYLTRKNTDIWCLEAYLSVQSVTIKCNHRENFSLNIVLQDSKGQNFQTRDDILILNQTSPFIGLISSRKFLLKVTRHKVIASP